MELKRRYERDFAYGCTFDNERSLIEELGEWEYEIDYPASLINEKLVREIWSQKIVGIICIKINEDCYEDSEFQWWPTSKI